MKNIKIRVQYYLQLIKTTSTSLHNCQVNLINKIKCFILYEYSYECIIYTIREYIYSIPKKCP